MAILQAGGAFVFSSVVGQSDSQVTAVVTASATAPVGLKNIIFQNPDGGPGPDSAGLTSCDCLTLS